MPDKKPITLADLRAKRDDILRLAEARGVYNVRVFGSVARGDANADSDVDLLVCFPDNYRLRDHAGLVVLLEQLLGYPVDIAIEQNLREVYRPHILKDAIPL